MLDVNKLISKIVHKTIRHSMWQTLNYIRQGCCSTQFCVTVNFLSTLVIFSKNTPGILGSIVGRRGAQGYERVSGIRGQRER